MLPNVTVDIYRSCNVESPYPVQGTRPDVAGINGELRHHVRSGRFGYQDPKIKWTHLLILEPGVDVRSAYNSWTGPAEAPADADTVLVKDYPIVGHCTAFYVVLVQRGGRGSRGDHLRVYLDRLRPRTSGCYVPGVQQSCGDCSVLPASWRLRAGGDYSNNGCDNCASLNNGSWALDHDSGCSWISATFSALCSFGAEQGPVFWHLFFQNGVGWRLALENAIVTVLIFDPIAAADFHCTAANTFVHPTWNFGTCSSASSATIDRA